MIYTKHPISRVCSFLESASVLRAWLWPAHAGELAVLCTEWRAGRTCPSAPSGGAGARAVAKGHEGRQDDHRTRGTEQRGDVEKRVSPGPEDPEKRCGFCFHKRKLPLRVYFVTSHRLIEPGKITSSFHDCAACSSHPTHWHGPLRRFPVTALTQLCLRKEK